MHRGSGSGRNTDRTVPKYLLNKLLGKIERLQNENGRLQNGNGRLQNENERLEMENYSLRTDFERERERRKSLIQGKLLKESLEDLDMWKSFVQKDDEWLGSWMCGTLMHIRTLQTITTGIIG